MAELEPKRKPPRFPCVAALLCAACLGAAVWTWMRYSYVWDVKPENFASLYKDVSTHRLIGRYIRLGLSREGRLKWRDYSVHERDYGVLEPVRHVHIIRKAGQAVPDVVVGRVVLRFSPTSIPGPYLALDIAASRFTAASIAGLVVGAMGVFVLTVALRHWLRERRAITELEAS